MNLVYYFTRTGNSEKIAQDIAAQVGGEVRHIDDDKNWKGIIGFIRGGYYASSKKKTDALYEKPGDGDSIYLCFPVWANTFPPAVRAFVDEVGKGKITAVASSGGGGLKERDGFVKVIDVLKDQRVEL